MSSIPSYSIEMSKESRYRNTPVILRTDTSNPEFGLWESDPVFRNAEVSSSYKVSDSDIGRLDLISWRVYGTPNYWWIIADANNLVDPIGDMAVSQVLKIPPREAIESYIRRKENE